MAWQYMKANILAWPPRLPSAAWLRMRNSSPAADVVLVLSLQMRVAGCLERQDCQARDAGIGGASSPLPIAGGDQQFPAGPVASRAPAAVGLLVLGQPFQRRLDGLLALRGRSALRGQLGPVGRRTEAVDLRHFAGLVAAASGGQPWRPDDGRQPSHRTWLAFLRIVLIANRRRRRPRHAGHVRRSIAPRGRSPGKRLDRRPLGGQPRQVANRWQDAGRIGRWCCIGQSRQRRRLCKQRRREPWLADTLRAGVGIGHRRRVLGRRLDRNQRPRRFATLGGGGLDRLRFGGSRLVKGGIVLGGPLGHRLNGLGQRQLVQCRIGRQPLVFDQRVALRLERVLRLGALDVDRRRHRHVVFDHRLPRLRLVGWIVRLLLPIGSVVVHREADELLVGQVVR